MYLQNILLVLATLHNCISGEPRPTSSSIFYSNTSSTSFTTALSQVTPSVCCFVAQDTAAEIYWPITSYDTEYTVVNVTSLTTYITPWPNGTVTNIVTNVHEQNESFTASWDIGKNPVSFYGNDRPSLPVEVPTELPWNATATVTGGVTVKSPQAFLVYSTVKIITAAPVTDANGNVACGTTSSWDTPGLNPSFLLTWPNINGNAEVYFGGNDIAGATSVENYGTDIVTLTSRGSKITVTNTRTFTDIFWTDSNGQTIVPALQTDGVVAEIVLSTPFILQPKRGATGQSEYTNCFQSSETELYGYIPQTLIDYMAGRPEYVAQYSNIASCLPAGPYVSEISECHTTKTATEQTAVGGDLTRSTVITITPSPRSSIVTAGQVPSSTPAGGQTSGNGGGNSAFIPEQGSTAAPSRSTTPPAGYQGAVPSSDPPHGVDPQGPANPSEVPASSGNGGAAVTQEAGTSLGAIINSFVGGNVVPSGGGSQQGGNPSGSTLITPPPGQPITITGPTTIPVSQAPPGLSGKTTVINGSSFLAVSGATTLAPLLGGIPIPVSLGSSTFISGTPVFIIPTATTVPAAGLPNGIGSTTLISGTPFVVIQPTEFPIPAAAGAQIFSTTVVAGTPFLFIPGPTSIPITAAPSGLIGSITVVGGTSFYVVPSATSVPALPGHVTISGGSTFVIFDGSSTVPVNPHLPLQGSSTLISGTDMVILPGATTVPFLPGSLTVISGSIFDVFTSGAMVPVNSELTQLVGRTTVISGTTEVFLTRATTVPVAASPSSIQIMVSGARRARVSWIGFGLQLSREFVARFRR